MAQNIKLKNGQSVEITYEGIQTIKVPAAIGSGVVSYVDTTIASTAAATSNDILSGKQAYVNGSLVSGSISSQTPYITTSSYGAKFDTITPGGAAKYIRLYKGYYNNTSYSNGAQYIEVLGDANLVATNIKKDVKIFGVTGTYDAGGTAVTNITNFKIGPVKYNSNTYDHPGTLDQSFTFTYDTTNCGVIYLESDTYTPTGDVYLSNHATQITAVGDLISSSNNKNFQWLDTAYQSSSSKYKVNGIRTSVRHGAQSSGEYSSGYYYDKPVAGTWTYQANESAYPATFTITQLSKAAAEPAVYTGSCDLYHLDSIQFYNQYGSSYYCSVYWYQPTGVWGHYGVHATDSYAATYGYHTAKIKNSTSYDLTIAQQSRAWFMNPDDSSQFQYSLLQDSATISHKLTNVATAKDLVINRGAEISGDESMSIPADSITFRYGTSVDWYVDGTLLKSSSTYVTVGNSSYGSSYDVAISKFDTLTVTNTSRIDITLEKIGSGDKSFSVTANGYSNSMRLTCSSKGWTHTFAASESATADTVWYNSGDLIMIESLRYGEMTSSFSVELDGSIVASETYSYTLNTTMLPKSIRYEAYGDYPRVVISTIE